LNAKKTKGTFRSGQTSLHLTFKAWRWAGIQWTFRPNVSRLKN